MAEIVSTERSNTACGFVRRCCCANGSSFCSNRHFNVPNLREHDLGRLPFSIVIALMLGVTAVILGALNMRLLLAVRDPDAEAVFEMIAKAHREIERYHDLRSIVLDESHTVLVAEVEFREEAILSGLRNRIDQNESDMLASVSEDRKADSNLREYIMDRAAVQATLERSEELIDELSRVN